VTRVITESSLVKGSGLKFDFQNLDFLWALPFTILQVQVMCDILIGNTTLNQGADITIIVGVLIHKI
jgi:hypothetical protein